MNIPIDQLRKLVPLANLTDEALEQLVDRGQVLELPRGRQLYRQGSTDDNIYYLLEGRISMTDTNDREAFLTADSEQARFAFGKLRPRPADAMILSETSRILCFSSHQFDTMLSWQQQLLPQEDSDPLFSDIPSSLLTSELQVDEVDVTYGDDWVMSLLSCPSFYNVPPANVQLLAEKMEPASYKAGDIVIEEGDHGDHYYVIREGRCRVIREGIVVGSLGSMDTFGEEALISGSLRNATIEMITDGLLMRLSQQVFLETLVPPLIKRVSLEEAKGMAMQGAILIDVRTRREYKQKRLIRSINIPLYIFRSKLRKLSHKKTYIVYCDTGKRSSVATFLLNQERFDAYLLDNPQEAFRIMVAKGDSKDDHPDIDSDDNIPPDVPLLTY